MLDTSALFSPGPAGMNINTPWPLSCPRTGCDLVKGEGGFTLDGNQRCATVSENDPETD